MNITTNDLAILVGMLLTLVLTNFMFASAGATGDQVNESDVPTLNLSATRFDFAGDRPDRPLGPNSFRIAFDEDEWPFEIDLNSTHWVVSTANSTDSSPACSYAIRKGLGTDVDTLDLTENGSVGKLEGEGWRLEMELENNITCLAAVEVLDSPSGGTGWLGGFIGGTSQAIIGVIDGIVYLANIVIWIIAVLIETIFNVVGLFVDLAGFGISLLGYMFSRYGTIQSQASGWAHLILLMPMIVIGAIFLKIGLALIDASNWI